MADGLYALDCCLPGNNQVRHFVFFYSRFRYILPPH